MDMIQLPKIYRKRFVPSECILLKDDIILHIDKELIVTTWNTLKPRNDIAKGISAYYIEKGFKVSKVFDKENKLVYWYCDIIHTNVHQENNEIVFEDLLIDVVIQADGYSKILDIDEAADALRDNIISQEQLIDALHKLNVLLNMIYTGEFSKIQQLIERFDAF